MANVVVMESCLSRCHTKTYMAGMFDIELLKGQLFTTDFFVIYTSRPLKNVGYFVVILFGTAILQCMMNAKLTQARQ